MRKRYGVREGTQYPNHGSSLHIGIVTELQLYEHLIKATNLAGESFDGPKAAPKARAEPSKQAEPIEILSEKTKVAPGGM